MSRKTKVVSCPRCGRPLTWSPHPDRPWRSVGRCVCSPHPLMERDATRPAPATPTETDVLEFDGMEKLAEYRDLTEGKG